MSNGVFLAAEASQYVYEALSAVWRQWDSALATPWPHIQQEMTTIELLSFLTPLKLRYRRGVLMPLAFDF